MSRRVRSHPILVSIHPGLQKGLNIVAKAAVRIEHIFIELDKSITAHVYFEQNTLI